MPRQKSPFSGEDLVRIILAAGLRDDSSSSVGDKFSALGYTVPAGSLRRALSKARGTWGGAGNISQIDGLPYQEGRQVFDTLQLKEGGLYLWQGSLASDMDIRNRISGVAQGIPVQHVDAATMFFRRQGEGRKISPDLRNAYEAALMWTYYNVGIEGAGAREWLEDVVDGVRSFFRDETIIEVEMLLPEQASSLEDAIMSL
jgi:hypothetical protein